MASETLAPSRALAAKVIFAALEMLKASGGQASGRDVTDYVEKHVALDDWAKHTYQKSGDVRWQAVLNLFSIDCIKAGYLIKKKGVWYITPDGENALSLGDIGLLNAASLAFKRWQATSRPGDVVHDEETIENSQQGQEATVQEMEQIAADGLRRQIALKNPYEFQDLVAALLRGMGYYTPFIAPLGKDGGVDIIAYRDPLGTMSPRIKAQIKHRWKSKEPANVQELRQLMGLLQKDGDVGIFVSSTGFTADAKATARTSGVHVELVDFDRFINLWREFYPNLRDEDKILLPLVSILFYSPSV
jgi:restriction system protein